MVVIILSGRMKETQSPLLTAIYNYLKGDSCLAELMKNSKRPVGEDWLHLNWASKDAHFPYLVHRIENSYADSVIVASAIYWLDIWDYNFSQEKILAIRGRLVTLLDQLYLAIILEEKGVEVPKICNARFYLTADDPIPDETEGIQRRSLRFDLRYDRLVEIEEMLKREEERGN